MKYQIILNIRTISSEPVKSWFFVQPQKKAELPVLSAKCYLCWMNPG